MTEEIKVPTLTSISGKPKSGKTHLSLTWPAPIKVYSFERGARYVAEKNFGQKPIEIVEFDLPIIEEDNPAPYAEPIWNGIQKMFKEDVYSGKFKTLIFDPATTLWSLLRQAITEAKNRKKLLEVEYALPNLKMSSFFNHSSKAGVNLVMVNYLKDKYVNGENTGELELSGWGQTEGAVDIVLEMKRITKAGKTSMETTIKDNRFNRDMNGQTMVDTNYDRLYLALLG